MKTLKFLGGLTAIVVVCVGLYFAVCTVGEWTRQWNEEARKREAAALRAARNAVRAENLGGFAGKVTRKFGHGFLDGFKQAEEELESK